MFRVQPLHKEVFQAKHFSIALLVFETLTKNRLRIVAEGLQEHNLNRPNVKPEYKEDISFGKLNFIASSKKTSPTF